MKIKQYIIYLLFVIGIHSSCMTSKQTPPKEIENLPWMPFTWKGEKVDKKYFDKAAMYFPFILEKDTFNLQIDLGANVTMLYENSIARYTTSIDTTAVTINGEKSYLINNISGKVGNREKWNKFYLLENFGDSIINSEISIGTIGADFFKNKVVVIDYPHKKILKLDSLPASLKQKIEFVRAEISDGRIRIPLTIGDSTYIFLFDTGSSIFELIAPRQLWEIIKEKNTVNNAELDTLMVPSWGRIDTVVGVTTNLKIKIGNVQLNLSKVYKGDYYDQINAYKLLKCDGITGNALFLQDIIVLDFKDKRFGIIKNKN